MLFTITLKRINLTKDVEKLAHRKLENTDGLKIHQNSKT